jgi:hypothetical protein
VRVSDSFPPAQATGIEPSVTAETLPATDVQPSVMPLREPQELTTVCAPTTFFDDGVTLRAPAAPGTARIAATATQSASPGRRMRYPVMTTDTPVTADAAMLLELKSGAAAPVPSSVPVTSASETLLVPVRVTL